MSINCDDNVNFNFYNFDIKPREYLKFAKQDLKDTRDRGLINALSNAKRSIDCTIESVLKGLHISYKDKKKIAKEIIPFCHDVLSQEDKDIKPIQLKLFCALGFAPSFLISEVRLLRNKIEHEYKIPKKEDVQKAIDVAELFISNVDNKKYTCSVIALSDTKSDKNIIIGESHHYDDNNKQIVIRASSNDMYYIVNETESIYYYLLRAIVATSNDEEDVKEAIKSLIKQIKPKQPSQQNQHINVKEVKGLFNS